MSGLEESLEGHVLAGRYRVERPIGRGGMGAVYRAIDQRLGRPVALKVIMVPGADAATQERLKQRFLREAQAAARLRHPNVVTVHDFGTDDAAGLDYLVMELLEGEDLARRTARGGRLAPAEALAVVSQAARGLAAGHRTGLVHRDVKPGNLFLELDEHGEVHVRVLDFGIAQVGWDEAGMSGAGRTLSPTYAAPEQLRGTARLTPAADVFGLGAVALFLLNGERPFTGDVATQGAEAQAALAGLDALPEVTPAVRDVLRRALEPDPDGRWSDANEFRRALEMAHGGGLDTLPVSVMGAAARADGPGGTDDDVTLFAAPADDRTLFAEGAAPAAPPPSTRPAPPLAGTAGRRPAVAPPPRKSRAPAVIAGIALLAAAGGALAYLQPWEPREPAGPPVATATDSISQDSLDRLAEADSATRMRRQQDLIQAAVDSVRQADSLARAREQLAQAANGVGDTSAVAPDVSGGTVPPSDPDVYELSAVEVLPQLRNRDDVGRYLERNYPPILRDSRVPGEVRVSFVVGTNGRVEGQSVQVLSSTHEAFEDPAIRAAERMRFTPAQTGGRRVRVRVLLPIQFQTSG
ncbi:TonB family protein [Longimicrobium sp.]|uniref:TonB family protein n=1 Tax=Longimicrobium sp. TaxID=2029185 RepID=UPI002E351577|nr:TonB family protein [Longimicrobium sp.]HEX6040325.1 TonB family protein [Longimicrobium sp.]